MGVASRLRGIHHSLSCLTPKLFTSAIFMTWVAGMFGDNEYSMKTNPPVHLLGFKLNNSSFHIELLASWLFDKLLLLINIQ